MSSSAGKTSLLATIIVVGLISAFFLTRQLELVHPPLPAGYEDSDLELEGSRLKGFVFGAEGLMADWYWMNSLQYLGGKVGAVGLNNLDLNDLSPLNPRLLYPYLNNATDLDPHFMAPYSYGATILPAIDSQQAIALTEKGIANNPTQWRLHQYLGYIYWRVGDYEKASEVYQQGSEVPGAPPFLKMMAARMKTEGGSRQIAREMYKQIRDEAQDDVSRESAELRLLQIDSLDERDVLNSALEEFKSANNRCPATWSDVLGIVARKTKNGPDLRIDKSNNFVDPSGEPYVLFQPKCTAELGLKTKVPRA